MGLAVVGLSLLAATVLALRGADSGAALRIRASKAGEEGRWQESLALWRRVNAGGRGDAASWLAEARAALTQGLAAQAEVALGEACRMDARRVDPWLIRLEILRLEGRTLEALRLGESAFSSVAPGDRPSVARAWTLAALADAPEGLARETLARWTRADPRDGAAEAALDRRRAESPRPDDPPYDARVERLRGLLDTVPGDLAVREALVLLLAEGGRIAEGGQVLDGWPSDARDARYHRLAGRWDLEYRERPDAAIRHFREALVALPHDWKVHYRLARALQAAGQPDSARAQAAEVDRLRELLDPARLGPRLQALLGESAPPGARDDLATLCRSLGLAPLAEAWDAAR
jgi:tetratricopeptide (TPR) repeat protein